MQEASSARATYRPGSPPKFVVGLTLAVLALVVAYSAWVSFTTKPVVAPLTQKERDNRAVIKALIQKSHGDYGKLSKDDLRTLAGVAGKYGKYAYEDVKEHWDD